MKKLVLASVLALAGFWAWGVGDRAGAPVTGESPIEQVNAAPPEDPADMTVATQDLPGGRTPLVPEPAEPTRSHRADRQPTARLRL